MEEISEERDQLKVRVETLTREIQQLHKQVSLGPKEEESISLAYIEHREKNRFIPKDIPLLLVPQESSQKINQIEANTVVEVNDFVDVHGAVWLYVTIPVFDTSMNMKGWIKEIDTQLYTLERRELVKSPITLKVGTPVYGVDLFNQVNSVSTLELDVEKNCFISDSKDEYLALGCSGGTSFIVKKSNATYPEIENIN
jgi:hypothetical protein